MMENKMTAPVSVPVLKLHPFRGHPYKVQDNEEMNVLIESIQAQGILSPLIVRPLENTADEYEVVSGHRRLHAAKKAGLVTVPAFIHALDRDAAAIAVVDSNLHREHILPSEKAFAYKLKLEAMKHQGKTSCQVGTKSRTDEQMAETADDSARQIQRYIRLTNLIPELLAMMDEGQIALSVGVELSYLPEELQQAVAEAVEYYDSTPSYAQAVRMHRERFLSREGIFRIMGEEKANQREQIRLRRDEFNAYFPVGYSDAQIRADILAGLDLLRRQRSRERDRDTR